MTRITPDQINGNLSVSARVYGVQLSRAGSGNWLMPVGVLPDTLVIAVDRWPVYRGIDYDIIGQEIVPRYPWSTFTNRDPANQMVMADFDR